jgi:hypothetical protein
MTRPVPGPPRPADPVEAIALAMAGLEGIENRPLTERVDAFERVHAVLGEALAAGSV